VSGDTVASAAISRRRRLSSAETHCHHLFERAEHSSSRFSAYWTRQCGCRCDRLNFETLWKKPSTTFSRRFETTMIAASMIWWLRSTISLFTQPLTPTCKP